MATNFRVNEHIHSKPETLKVKVIHKTSNLGSYFVYFYWFSCCSLVFEWILSIISLDLRGILFRYRFWRSIYCESMYSAKHICGAEREISFASMMRQSGGCFTTFLGGQSLGVKSHRGMQTMAMQLGKPCQTLPCELVGGREIASCFFFKLWLAKSNVVANIKRNEC